MTSMGQSKLLMGQPLNTEMGLSCSRLFFRFRILILSSPSSCLFTEMLMKHSILDTSLSFLNFLMLATECKTVKYDGTGGTTEHVDFVLFLFCLVFGVVFPSTPEKQNLKAGKQFQRL